MQAAAGWPLRVVQIAGDATGAGTLPAYKPQLASGGQAAREPTVAVDSGAWLSLSEVRALGFRAQSLQAGQPASCRLHRQMLAMRGGSGSACALTL